MSKSDENQAWRGSVMDDATFVSLIVKAIPQRCWAKIKMKWRTSTQVVFERRTCQVRKQPSPRALKQRGARHVPGTGRQRERLKSRQQRKNDGWGCREKQGPHHEGSYKGTVRTLDFKQDGKSWSGAGGVGVGAQLEECPSWERTMAWTSVTAEEKGHYLSYHTQDGMKEGTSGECLYHSKSVGWQKRKLKKKVIRGWAISQEVWT